MTAARLWHPWLRIERAIRAVLPDRLTRGATEVVDQVLMARIGEREQVERRGVVQLKAQPSPTPRRFEAVAAGVAAMVGLFLAGCATSVYEVRQRDPSHVGTASAQYRQLADCVLEELKAGPGGAPLVETADLVYQLGDTKAERVARITGRNGESVLIELSFAEAEAGTVKIESRRGHAFGIEAGARRIERRAWPIIERCAGAKIAVTPSLD